MAALWMGKAGYGVRLGVVAVSYFVCARLSLDFALVHGQVTPVWPPTGIAVVSMLVFGERMWPAIAVAAFAINLPLGPNPLGAACIAAGNTLAPLVAVAIMRRADFHVQLDRLRDAGVLIAAALLGTALSATVGSTVLTLLGSTPAGAFPQTWAVWWTGDAMGVLLVAPFLLCLLPGTGRNVTRWRDRAELIGLLAAIAVVTYMVFQNQLRLEYLVFPLIMVAALRFRLLGAAPAALIASGVAVIAAVKGTGPFATESLLPKMVTLQVFNVFLTLASFVLSAYVDARDREHQARLSNKAKSEFLRVAAHELRGPLTVIAGYVSLLAGGDLGSPPERWLGPLEIVSAKTRELNGIMDQLLDVARLDGDAAVRRRQPVDLREIAAAAAERARPRAALAGGDVAVEDPGVPVVANVDSNQVGHILDNLLNNSLAYSKRPPRIVLRPSAEDGKAVIRVTDNGSGVPPDAVDVIFEPFRRGIEPGDETVPGSGLGLYISRELAHAHGGEVLLESSSPGEGSTFRVTLPLVVTESPVRA